MRYSISKFRNFSGIFSEFFRDFSDFEYFCENATLIFEIEIHRNAPIIFEVKIYKNAPPWALTSSPFPCSMCFSRNHVDGKCVENIKDYGRSYVSSYNLCQGREYATYNHDSQPLFPLKPCFHQYIQHQMIENNANVSTLQDILSMIEKLSKGVQNMNEKMSDLVRRVEKLKTTTNLDQSNPIIEIMGGKENEVDYNQDTFLPGSQL